MLEWLRRMFTGVPKVSPPPIDALPEGRSPGELETYRVEQRRILDRADQAIREAMAHADAVFRPHPYRGPERRRKPR